VSYYQHHGGWWVYYREQGRVIRRRAADTEDVAAQFAAQINAQLSVKAPTFFSFVPLPVSELRRQFLDYHEHVIRSTLATVSRYRSATQHLDDYANTVAAGRPAHELDAEGFVRYLRSLQVAPNGHVRAARRPLRDKGIHFILETCRSLFGYAAKKRHLPPYAENPFAGLGGKKFRIEDAKPVFVFDENTELAFLKAADPWSFPIHFTLAKTGIRPGELVHLLVEDLDLSGGRVFIRNKTDLGWRIKTGRERAIPLIDEVVVVLKQIIGSRTTGVVFRREKFNPSACPLALASRRSLAAAIEQRIASEASGSTTPSRSQQAAIARSVWKDAGATKPDRIRQSFIRLADQLDLVGATCPKSWRHTFATLLQDANVDPLIRQLTLGHAFSGSGGALGMTSIYTHTRPETQVREIERALRNWSSSLALARSWLERQLTM
jgi:integrase